MVGFGPAFQTLSVHDRKAHVELGLEKISTRVPENIAYSVFWLISRPVELAETKTFSPEDEVLKYYRQKKQSRKSDRRCAGPD